MYRIRRVDKLLELHQGRQPAPVRREKRRFPAHAKAQRADAGKVVEREYVIDVAIRFRTQNFFPHRPLDQHAPPTVRPTILE